MERVSFSPNRHGTKAHALWPLRGRQVTVIVAQVEALKHSTCMLVLVGFPRVHCVQSSFQTLVRQRLVSCPAMCLSPTNHIYQPHHFARQSLVIRAITCSKRVQRLHLKSVCPLLAFSLAFTRLPFHDLFRYHESVDFSHSAGPQGVWKTNARPALPQREIVLFYVALLSSSSQVRSEPRSELQEPLTKSI